MLMPTFFPKKIMFKYIRKMFISAVEVTKHTERYRVLACRPKHRQYLLSSCVLSCTAYCGGLKNPLSEANSQQFSKEQKLSVASMAHQRSLSTNLGYISALAKTSLASATDYLNYFQAQQTRRLFI